MFRKVYVWGQEDLVNFVPIIFDTAIIIIYCKVTGVTETKVTMLSKQSEHGKKTKKLGVRGCYKGHN